MDFQFYEVGWRLRYICARHLEISAVWVPQRGVSGCTKLTAKVLIFTIFTATISPRYCAETRFPQAVWWWVDNHVVCHEIASGSTLFAKYFGGCMLPLAGWRLSPGNKHSQHAVLILIDSPDPGCPSWPLPRNISLMIGYNPTVRVNDCDTAKEDKVDTRCLIWFWLVALPFVNFYLITAALWPDLTWQGALMEL